ncbi:MAG: DeoR/GlpR family DNA-binding transcription regulator [Burkholderiaceae bacterium]
MNFWDVNRPTLPTHLNGGVDAMSMEERRRQIRTLIETAGRVSSDALALRFNTSAVTIRSDLRALAASGALLRTHGGAVSHREGDEVPLAIRAGHHHCEKVRIAQAAVGLIRDGDTILLDSGSTTHELAKQLALKPLTSVNVITNALNVAMALAHARHVNLVMLGGSLRANSFTLSGPQSEAALATLSADRLFLGVDSLDPERGLMTPHLMEAQLNAKMIRVARQVIAVADSSKLQRRNLSVIGALECLDMLITDVRATPSVINAIRDRGVDVMVV